MCLGGWGYGLQEVPFQFQFIGGNLDSHSRSIAALVGTSGGGNDSGLGERKKKITAGTV